MEPCHEGVSWVGAVLKMRDSFRSPYLLSLYRMSSAIYTLMEHGLLVVFLVAVTKYLIRQLEEEKALFLACSLKLRSIVAGKAWQQELKTAGHIGVNKQTEMTTASY